MRVFNDTTASALGYGITKTDLPDPSAKPRTVAFVDMGYSSYQIAIVQFTKGNLVVKSTAFDRNLGGRDFDQALANHFIEEFKTKYKMDVSENKKAAYRLRTACEKVKKILSANAVTMLNVECLMNDRDVSAQIQRPEFEEMIAPLITRITPPLEEALKLAGVSKDDIDAVEIVGGSTRIPIVKATLENFFGAGKLSTTLNLDEAVARGCALQCAILSPVFKVRDFSVQDYNSFPITLSWDQAGKNEVMNAFPIGNVVPSTKMMTMVRKEEEGDSFKLNADYSELATERGAPAGYGLHIGTWTISGIKKREPLPNEIPGEGDPSKFTIKVKTRVDGNGVVCVESAAQIEEVVVKEEVAPMEVDKKEEEKPAEGKEPKKEAPKPKEEAAPKEAEVKTKKLTRKHDLVVVPQTASLPVNVLTQYQSAEGSMIANDRLVRDTEEAKNTVEEYVYETRSKLEMAWSEYVKEEDRSAFLQILNDAENWLYSEEGEEATKSVYNDKLKSLKKLGDPIASRVREEEDRAPVLKEFKEYILSLSTVSIEDEKYNHIPAEEMANVHADAKKKSDWIRDLEAKFNECPKHQNPPVTVEEIKKQRRDLEKAAKSILNKPKPVPKKEEKKEEEKKEDAKMEEPEKPAEDANMEAPPAPEKEEMQVD